MNSGRFAPSTRIEEGKKIGLALGGGGVRGIAYISLLKALVAAGFEIGAIHWQNRFLRRLRKTSSPGFFLTESEHAK